MPRHDFRHAWASFLYVQMVWRLFHNAEFFFSHSAQRAYPIGWYVVEICARLDAVFRVAYCGVVFPSAYVAYILFHSCCNFSVVFIICVLSHAGRMESFSADGCHTYRFCKYTDKDFNVQIKRVKTLSLKCEKELYQQRFLRRRGVIPPRRCSRGLSR